MPFLKHEPASIAYEFARTTNSVHGIAFVGEEEAPDDCVGTIVEPQAIDRFGSKPDLIETLMRSTPLGVGNDAWIFVYADNDATGSDALGDKQREIGKAVTGHDYAHTRSDARTREQLFGQWLRKGCLNGT